MRTVDFNIVDDDDQQSFHIRQIAPGLAEYRLHYLDRNNEWQEVSGRTQFWWTAKGDLHGRINSPSGVGGSWSIMFQGAQAGYGLTSFGVTIGLEDLPPWERGRLQTRVIIADASIFNSPPAPTPIEERPDPVALPPELMLSVTLGAKQR